jgi:hypothetical protein
VETLSMIFICARNMSSVKGLNKDFLSLDVGEPSAPDLVVTVGRDLPGDGRVLK